MRVILVIDKFDPSEGGRARWTVQFAVHLCGRGHEVHVVAFQQANLALPLTVHIVAGGRTVFDKIAALDARVRGLGPAVVHDTGSAGAADVFQPQTGSNLLSFRRDLAGVPVARRLARMLRPKLIWWQICLAQIERRQVRNAGRIVAVSGLVRSVLVKQHSLPPAAITVVHNGVDTARFSPAAVAVRRPAARVRLGVDDATTVFVMVAHNLRLKNADTVLRALAQVRAAGVRVKLAIAGGRADAGHATLIARAGIADDVIFCGYCEDVLDVMAAADCLVHPTRWDACSLTTLEAAACGIPVITTAANGAAEAVTDGVSGYVLNDPGDAGALAARMRQMAQPGLRGRMGAAARVAAEAFDCRDKFAAVEAMLADIAAARGCA